MTEAPTISNAVAEQLLEDLISVPSPSGEEAEASAYLVNWMAAHGLEALVDEAGNAVGRAGEGELQIVLLGHIDTFPGEVPVRRQGRALYGRGAVDAKGPLAAFAVAAARVAPQIDVELIVVGATEEESATSKGARHALRCYTPNYCLIGEPSGWDRLCLGYKGRLNLRWRWRGALAHSAGPSPTPGETAISAWNSIDALVASHNVGRPGPFEQLQASLTGINTDRTGAHGEASLHVTLRLPPRLSSSEVESQLAERLSGAEVEFFGQEEPYVAGKSNPLTRAMLEFIRAEGGDPRFVLKTGTSDMNVVGPVWGCAIAAYGPGDSRFDHTPDEQIDLDEYLRAIQVLQGALRRMGNA